MGIDEIGYKSIYERNFNIRMLHVNNGGLIAIALMSIDTKVNQNVR